MFTIAVAYHGYKSSLNHEHALARACLTFKLECALTVIFGVLAGLSFAGLLPPQAVGIACISTVSVEIIILTALFIFSRRIKDP